MTEGKLIRELKNKIAMGAINSTTIRTPNAFMCDNVSIKNKTRDFCLLPFHFIFFNQPNKLPWGKVIKQLVSSAS
jgi:hypothetical protein